MSLLIKIKDDNGQLVEAGFKFNNWAFEHYAIMKGKALSMDSIAVALIYCGYCGWCYARQKDEQLTFENIIDWVDSETDKLFVESLIEEIKKSKFWIKWMQEVDNILKKNAPQPISEETKAA